MFKYLVTSKTRRTLLSLLWGEERSGTVANFAKWAKVAFAGAHKELHAMKAAGLVKTEWENGREVFCPVKDHPMKDVLKKLVRSEDATPTKAQDTNSQVKAELAYLGLPVNTPKHSRRSNESLEALFAAACRLARTDASVARSLPVLVSKYRNSLDYKTLDKECRQLGQRHVMGFFLGLAGHLMKDDDLEKEAEHFRDNRRKKPVSFFVNPSKLSMRMVKEKTPELAKSWNWLMNMSMDSFTSTFEKFCNASSPTS